MKTLAKWRAQKRRNEITNCFFQVLSYKKLCSESLNKCCVLSWHARISKVLCETSVDELDVICIWKDGAHTMIVQNSFLTFCRPCILCEKKREKTLTDLMLAVRNARFIAIYRSNHHAVALFSSLKFSNKNFSKKEKKLNKYRF